MRLRSPYLIGFLITLFGVMVISPDTLLIRLIDAGHWTQLFWRGVLSGGLILTVYLLRYGRAGLTGLIRMGRYGVIVILSFGTGNLCFVYSASHTLVANTLFIVSTSPIFAALIARFILREPVGTRTWLTITTTLIGIGIIATGSFSGGGGTLSGDLAALAVAIALATTFSIARLQRARSMVPAMAVASILSGLFAGIQAPTLVIPAEDIIWMGMMGLLVVPVGFACIATGPRYIPAADVSLLLLLEAVFGPLLVWWFIGEDPGAMTLLGGGLVLGALAVSNLWLILHSRQRLAGPPSPDV